ncbi:MAG: 4Fe-4S dicluster domain-containing protein [Deltaproteobacteria bacterium]|nr:MAG: 4Fe-4S dicluster domain-containing protein [Deltaproteobacteria bacterium]
MEPMGKVLTINYEKCTGCRLCELVCAVKHDGISNPLRSRIKVMKWEAEGLYIPMSCQQCQDAPCMIGCPVKAISKNEALGGRVEVDYDVCIGCRTCVAVCPFGAMSFNPIDRKVIKCDLCDGNPQCVRFCEVKAVDFVDAGDVSTLKKKEAARRLSVAGKEAAALQDNL